MCVRIPRSGGRRSTPRSNIWDIDQNGEAISITYMGSSMQPLKICCGLWNPCKIWRGLNRAKRMSKKGSNYRYGQDTRCWPSRHIFPHSEAHKNTKFQTLARGLVAQNILFRFSCERSQAPLLLCGDLHRNRMLIVPVYWIMIPRLYYYIRLWPGIVPALRHQAIVVSEVTLVGAPIVDSSLVWRVAPMHKMV